ncbi:MAG TPA: hypothetical protein VMI75_35055, partial [Polyangiaceae bacterium]|nr:hypothetical protein [Polyangiaceae bacterium]
YQTADGYIRTVVSTVNDAKVAYLPLGTQDQDAAAQGCEGHPTVATQAAVAGKVILALEQALGW